MHDARDRRLQIAESNVPAMECVHTLSVAACLFGCVHVDDGLAQNRRKHARVRYEKQVQVATLSGMT